MPPYTWVRVSGKSPVRSTTPPVYPGLEDDSFACLERHLRILVKATINAPNAPIVTSLRHLKRSACPTVLGSGCYEICWPTRKCTMFMIPLLSTTPSHTQWGGPVIFPWILVTAATVCWYCFDNDLEGWPVPNSDPKSCSL